ncbi:MAG: FIST C-terminal domain-containing protein [Thiocapsa sp.]|jgi:small ligand-binding sensory domain FIST|nr:FIST N-terminal domain-containing protein [Thiocapsa sp.]MCG6895900.1 FIST C-terminal domain-containing protein [Thiocapsa sp.]MCG6986017.1 FIST C-terminal domain-containing protein [Thiocapsa sp.]
MDPFRFGHAAAPDWRQAADRCLSQLGRVPAAATLGFLYVTDSLADELDDVLEAFRDATGISQWVGSVGMGICATGAEYYDEPAIAVMLGELPPDDFRIFPSLVEDLDDFDALHGDWIQTHEPHLGLVHGDPSNGLTENLIQQLAQRTTAGFLVGGLASSRGDTLTLANGLTRGGLSGVLFSGRVGILTRLSQGCSPIGPHHAISDAQRNILIRLDGEPALDVLKRDIGEILARDLSRLGGYIFAGLPIPASDTGDYLVRNLVGIDPSHGLVAIGDLVEPGGELMFCRRDADTAREDLARMLQGIKGRLSGPPRGGIYISCLGRGVNLFGPDSAELRQIQAALGDVPVVGFYANGEISRDRLYGYTGVLTLFT